MFYTKFRTDTCGVRLRNENTEIHTVFGIVSPSLAKQFQRDAHLDKHGAKTRLPDLVRCSPEGRRPNRQRERERDYSSRTLGHRERCHPLVVPFCSTRMVDEGSHEPPSLSLSFSRVFSSRNIRQGRSNSRETNRSHGL